MRVTAGETTTGPWLACPLVSLGAAEAGVGAGGSDDSSGVTPSDKVLANEAPPGKVTPGEVLDRRSNSTVPASVSTPNVRAEM